MDDDVVFVGKKAGIAYFGVIFAVVVALFVVLIISEVATAGSSEPPLWFFVAVVVIIALGALKWKSLNSTRWVVKQNQLIREWGFLPWTKRQFTYSTMILEAGYKVGFFKTLFGYSTIWMTTSHGTTQEHSEPYMKDVKRLAEEILLMVRRCKEAEEPAAAAAPQKSAVDELKELAALRANSDLSDEEFEMMKAKILEGHSSSA